MNNADYDLKPMQRLELDIYREIVKIMDRHHLRHYTTGGTTIGAMRHKGFIPWDDDFDMSIPQPDLYKFFEYAKAELPSWLSVVSWRTFPGYTNMYSKVILNDPQRLEIVCRESGLPAPEGVFVDLFMMVGCPTSWLGRWSRVLVVGLCRVLMKYTRWGFLNGVMEWVASLTPYDRARRVTSWGAQLKSEVQLATYDKRLWLTRQDYGEGRWVPFEDGLVRVPTNVEAYLEQGYGDWRRLPPEEARHPEHLSAELATRPWRLGPRVSASD